LTHHDLGLQQDFADPASVICRNQIQQEGWTTSGCDKPVGTIWCSLGHCLNNLEVRHVL
jgi:hypothetical protein